MNSFTLQKIDSSDDDELFKLIGKELEQRISAPRGSREFLNQIMDLPIGLRAMAATYELDVSLTLDDLGWHFGNWHSHELTDETARGLEELGATEMASVFRQAYEIAKLYWAELGSDKWMAWYAGSALDKAVAALNTRAWDLQKSKGIFKFWIEYARRYPERIWVEEVS